MLGFCYISKNPNKLKYVRKNFIGINKNIQITLQQYRKKSIKNLIDVMKDK